VPRSGFNLGFLVLLKKRAPIAKKNIAPKTLPTIIKALTPPVLLFNAAVVDVGLLVAVTRVVVWVVVGMAVVVLVVTTVMGSKHLTPKMGSITLSSKQHPSLVHFRRESSLFPQFFRSEFGGAIVGHSPTFEILVVLLLDPRPCARANATSNQDFIYEKISTCHTKDISATHLKRESPHGGLGAVLMWCSKGYNDYFILILIEIVLPCIGPSKSLVHQYKINS
jgi:hypothetical protein